MVCRVAIITNTQTYNSLACARHVITWRAPCQTTAHQSKYLLYVGDDTVEGLDRIEVVPIGWIVEVVDVTGVDNAHILRFTHTAQVELGVTSHPKANLRPRATRVVAHVDID